MGVFTPKAVWFNTVWALLVLVGLVLPLWEGGPPVETGLSLVIAGLLLKAREVHAEKPGIWFPLLVTGSVLFALALTRGSIGWWVLWVDPQAFDLGRFLVGLAVAVGLGFWAWRARSSTIAATAAGYLAALWLSLPMDAEQTGWMSYMPLPTPEPSFDVNLPPYPELVVVAGAVFAHARMNGLRPWHVLAIVGLPGLLVQVTAATLLSMALLVVALLAAAYDLDSRRPGAWYPLLVVGVGLVVWLAVDRVIPASPFREPGISNLPDGQAPLLMVSGRSAATESNSAAGYDEVFLAVVVAIALAVWSWRRKSPIMLLTGLVYVGFAYVTPNQETLVVPLFITLSAPPAQFVVLAGAALAYATATTRTVGGMPLPGR
ncbi:hypothetical protein F4560_003915 [Saccharothrix ecbatanensis]|uniref:Uncharacterized protein n=1 Tax=Saccharothrix ecbatanensis TaxID=1105145 RepID=A0A7W9M1S1_9PSEU|nr:hypothetical protein [Saccharothrix ecbatanensis]MBB5804147.1 hypothetical protein [Saccharothrix ecbatanensis]